MDGREENDSPENLIWTCRSCNVLAANTLRKHGVGRITHQYNPAEGAKTLGHWLTAVQSMKGESNAMSVRDAVAMIRATSARKRSQFASDIWYRRKARGNPSGTKGRFARCVKAVSKRGGAVDPRAVCGAQENRYRKNPAEASAQAFEEFQGRPSEQLVTVTKKVHFHRHLAAAGKLRGMVIDGVDGYRHKVRDFGGAFLAFNESKNQLFVEGGDQKINLADYGIRKPHEIETLGKVVKVDYHTRKDHLGSSGGTAVYRHKFRTVNQDGKPVTVKILRYPDLIYYVRDEQLVFSGGSYEILPEGINQ